MKTKTNRMKTNNKTPNNKMILLFICFLLIAGLTANAQISLPDGGNPNIPDAPIDGFLSIGLIAGACIGLRKRIKGIKV